MEPNEATGVEPGPDDIDYGVDDAPEAGAPDQGDDAQPEREPLPPEELARRYRNTTQALKAERARSRRAQREQQEAFESFQRAVAAELQARRPAAPEGPPDLQEDPFGALSYVMQRVTAYEQDQRQQQQAQQAQAAQQQAVTRAMGTIQDYEDEFAAARPDYSEAMEALLADRVGELIDAGYADAQALAAVQYEMLQIGGRALQEGRNPAEVYYRQAVRRGWRGSRQQNQETVRRLQQGQRAAASHGGGRGGGGQAPTLKQITKLSGAAFEAAAKKFLDGVS